MLGHSGLFSETFGSSSFGILFKTIQPTQYVSYRIGDEGWRVQNNWFNYSSPSKPKAIAELDYTNPNFFNVLANPLVVNGVISTTRFVDVDGVQVFSATGNKNKVVIDKLTGLMYTRNNPFVDTWNNCIDNALTYSISVNGFTYDDWFLASYNEYKNIVHDYAGVLPYLDTLTSIQLFSININNWTSTTHPDNTTNAFLYRRDIRIINDLSKVNTLGSYLVRNAQTLITAP